MECSTSSHYATKGARGVTAQEVRFAHAGLANLRVTTTARFLGACCGRAGPLMPRARASWRFYFLPQYGHATCTTTTEREKQLYQSFPLSVMPTQTITPSAAHQIPPADAIFDAVFERSGNFRIELPFEQAQTFIRRIDQYNEFNAPQVLDALDRIDGLIPRKQYGPGNPNNGQRDYRISVGREGSPVIYLERFEFFDTPWLDTATMNAICLEMELTASADESHHHIEDSIFLKGRKVEFRFWWD